jgi:hypothetical protein
LIENGYIDRKHILYGVPSLYTTTHKGRQLIGISGKSDKIKVEQITHDIAVVDTVIYFHFDYGVKLSPIMMRNLTAIMRLYTMHFAMRSRG